jgi:hypothetical protein
MHPPHFVLIHAPLTGPLTWSLTAAVLRGQGLAVSVPVLSTVRAGGKPYWQQHVEAAAASVEGADSTDAPLILVAHSGAGPLLPAMRSHLRCPVAADILVDALYPEDGKSRLDLFENPWAADEFRRSAEGGLLPVWVEEDLREVITDDAVRRGFIEELRPLPLAVYEEPIPVFAGWPNAPGAYLRFGANPAYERSFALARQAGFALEQMDGEHFEMLEHPARVAQALIALARRLGIPVGEDRLDA